MAEFSPEQLAALRKIREERIEESRAKHGKIFTSDDVERLMREVEEGTGAERRKEPKRGSSILEQLAEFFRGPSLRLAYVAGAAAVIVLVVVLVMPSKTETIQLAALPDTERAGGVSLPKNFRLDLKKLNLELSENGDRISGGISSDAKASKPGVAAFAVLLEGKDNAGVEARFRGTLWLTNAAGVSAIQKTADIAGARLAGSFEISGRSTNTVSQAFR